jgi:hypothetical protein
MPRPLRAALSSREALGVPTAPPRAQTAPTAHDSGFPARFSTPTAPSSALGAGGGERSADTGVVLAEIQSAIVYFASSDNPIQRAIAEWMRANSTSLTAHVLSIKNERGRSFADELITGRRDALLRELGRSIADIPLYGAFTRYKSNEWGRDKSNSNPYVKNDPRRTFYEALMLKDRVPTLRHLRNILMLSR